MVTQSAFELWWYTHVRGYEIELARQVPKAGLFGRIKYTTSWVLSTKK
jgi:hypothetical protein